MGIHAHNFSRFRRKRTAITCAVLSTRHFHTPLSYSTYVIIFLLFYLNGHNLPLGLCVLASYMIKKYKCYYIPESAATLLVRKVHFHHL
jgi:hypothetical protein